MRLGMLSIGLLHCYWVTLCDSWHKNSSRMALFDALWHCVLPLDHILEVFTGVQVWSLGWPWQSLDLVVLHPKSLAVLHGALSCGIKTILWFGKHCQNRRKLIFFQDNLVRGLSHASFTKTGVPDCDLLWWVQFSALPNTWSSIS